MSELKLIYSSIDGYRKVYPCASMAELRKLAYHWVGENADVGRYYAVSFDGIGKVEVEGCTIRDVFPER